MLHVFKLISGEDIFAWVKEESETGYLIEDPCTVIFHPNSGVIMKHWMALTLENITYLPKQHILSDLGQANELAEYYYHTYMDEAKRVNKEALDTYAESIKDPDPHEEFFRNLMPTVKTQFN